MVFQEVTCRKKKKSSIRKVCINLSKMPRTGKKEKTSYNTTNIITKCNHMTRKIGKEQQGMTEIFLLNIGNNEIIMYNKM